MFHVDKSSLLARSQHEPTRREQSHLALQATKSTNYPSQTTQSSLSRRITCSILVMTFNLFLFFLSTLIPTISPSIFFPFLLLSTVSLAASSAYLQNATIALSSRFGPLYLQGILSGQGAIGVVVALLQFATALSAEQMTLNTVEAIDNNVRTSAFWFFLLVGIFSLGALGAHIILVRLRIYKIVIPGSTRRRPLAPPPLLPPSDEIPPMPTPTFSLPPLIPSAKALPTISTVEPKIRIYGFSIFYVFFVTLSVFPSITSSILSVHDSAQTWYQKPILFVPLGFITFAAGDWVGRALPQLKSVVWKSRRGLLVASLARTGFVVSAESRFKSVK